MALFTVIVGSAHRDATEINYLLDAPDAMSACREAERIAVAHDSTRRIALYCFEGAVVFCATMGPSPSETEPYVPDVIDLRPTWLFNNPPPASGRFKAAEPSKEVIGLNSTNALDDKPGVFESVDIRVRDIATANDLVTRLAGGNGLKSEICPEDEGVIHRVVAVEIPVIYDRFGIVKVVKAIVSNAEFIAWRRRKHDEINPPQPVEKTNKLTRVLFVSLRRVDSRMKLIRRLSDHGIHAVQAADEKDQVVVLIPAGKRDDTMRKLIGDISGDKAKGGIVLKTIALGN